MLKYSLSLIFRSKLRTFLTSLGITIAVVLLSLIIFGMEGLRDVFTSEFTSRFQPNEVVLSNYAFSGFMMGPQGAEGTSSEKEEEEPTVITPEIIESIKKDNRVDEVRPALSINGMQIRLEDQQKSFFPAITMGMDIKGNSHYFSDFEGDKNLKEGDVFVSTLVRDFYKLSNKEIIGKKLIIEANTTSLLTNKTKNQINKTYEFDITGVVDSGVNRLDAVITLKDASDILADTGDFDSGEEYLETVGYDSLSVELKNKDDIDSFKDFVKDKFNLSTFSSDDILSFLGLITTGITLILVFFGIVSAFVASIGIINTMVMSIYEQTREIGINKAIGASNFQILIIFLIQSGTIGFIGGVLGLLIVIGVTTITDPFIINLLQNQGFSAEKYFTLDPMVILGIIISCIVVGVIAGIYPAIKASRLDPVKALRYE